jgi:AcrR family transcriptional regulator
MQRRAANGVSEFAFADGVAGPRKQPTQDRSKHTVAAILEATIRILDEAGSAGLTTTRVAEVAGVSVGTLYQYFPNRDALLNALLADHLEAAISAVEAECVACAGVPLADAAPRVVRAFLAAKATRAVASRIMNKAFGIGMLDDRPLVVAATHRAHLAIAKLVSGGTEPSPEVLSQASLACSALEGIVRAAIMEDPDRLHDPVWTEQVVRIATAALAR